MIPNQKHVFEVFLGALDIEHQRLQSIKEFMVKNGLRSQTAKKYCNRMCHRLNELWATATIFSNKVR